MQHQRVTRPHPWLVTRQVPAFMYHVNKRAKGSKEVFCHYCLNYCTPRLLIMLKRFVSAGPMTSSPQSDIVDRQLPQDP